MIKEYFDKMKHTLVLYDEQLIKFRERIKEIDSARLERDELYQEEILKMWQEFIDIFQQSIDNTDYLLEAGPKLLKMALEIQQHNHKQNAWFIKRRKIFDNKSLSVKQRLTAFTNQLKGDI